MWIGLGIGITVGLLGTVVLAVLLHRHPAKDLATD